MGMLLARPKASVVEGSGPLTICSTLNCSITRFKTAKGDQLCGYYWPAHGTPKAQIVLVHGHAVYLTYDYLKPMVRLVQCGR